MKNEKLVRAISDIDDDLIEEAHADLLRRRTPGVWLRLASAACLAAVIFAAVIWHRVTDVNISLFGKNAVDHDTIMLSEEDDVINHAVMRYQSVDPDDYLLGIPVHVEANGKTAVSVFGGGLFVRDRDSDGLLSSGVSAELSGDADIVWEVCLMDTAARYEMKIINRRGEFTITLSYDEEADDWKLTTEK